MMCSIFTASAVRAPSGSFLLPTHSPHTHLAGLVYITFIHTRAMPIQALEYAARRPLSVRHTRATTMYSH